MVLDIIKPKHGSVYNQYLENTVEYIKQKDKEKVHKLKLYNTIVGKKLFFVTITFPPSTVPIQCLVDTGASNSLLHQSIVNKLDLPIKPTSMRMATATGTSTNIITGTSHLTFQMRDVTNNSQLHCTNFIITKKLNGMNCILGAEFLLDDTRVLSISRTHLVITDGTMKYCIPISSEHD